MQTLLERDVPVAFFSAAGRYYGCAHGLGQTGVDARRGQYQVFSIEKSRLKLAKETIRAKINNQRVMMMRNGDAKATDIEMMKYLRNSVDDVQSLDSLRGVEGEAAAIYFANFSTMLKDEAHEFVFNERNRRPPKDPVNALLSLAYSMLVKEVSGVCHSVGLDPYLGFFHQPRYGKPALALDLMEEFRPLIADSVVISLINRGEVSKSDFSFTTKGVYLSTDGRKSFWSAWFRRMDTLVSHPQFKYRMTYRRMIEVQVRQLWRYPRGETSNYFGFTTR
jgi:CRISPR-associated protein Cas1